MTLDACNEMSSWMSNDYHLSNGVLKWLETIKNAFDLEPKKERVIKLNKMYKEDDVNDYIIR